MKLTSFRMACLLVPALAVLAGSSVHAQVVTYTFPDGDEHLGSVAASQVNANATATAITRTNLYPGAGNININGYFEVGGDGGFTTANTYDASKYLSFTITPDAGYYLHFNPNATLTFNVGIQDTSAGSPGGIDVRYSNNGFLTSTDLGSTAVTNFSGQSVTLNANYLSNALSTSGGQFRFYFDGAPNPYETGLIGDIVVGGRVSLVPEPTAYTLLLGGVAALAAFRRRRRMTV